MSINNKWQGFKICASNQKAFILSEGITTKLSLLLHIVFQSKYYLHVIFYALLHHTTHLFSVRADKGFKWRVNRNMWSFLQCRAPGNGSVTGLIGLQLGYRVWLPAWWKWISSDTLGVFRQRRAIKIFIITDICFQHYFCISGIWRVLLSLNGLPAVISTVSLPGESKKLRLGITMEVGLSTCSR